MFTSIDVKKNRSGFILCKISNSYFISHYFIQVTVHISRQLILINGYQNLLFFYVFINNQIEQCVEHQDSDENNINLRCTRYD